jgi:transposase
MKKNRRHEFEFRLKIIKENLQGKSIRLLSKTWKISPTLIRKWIDHHQSSGVNGLLPKSYHYYTVEFKRSVVEAYNNKGLSLRDCCLHFNIPTLSTVFTWLKRYESLGLDGLVEQRGRPCIMKKDKLLLKKQLPLTRLEELEKENLYLKAENDYLKKLDALTQAKQTPQRKRR